MSSVWPFRSSPRPPSITDFLHWDLNGGGFALLFRALPSLLRPDSFLGLAEGVWSSEIVEFLTRHALQVDASTAQTLPREFRDAVFLPVTEPVTAGLAALADRHAAPEIALHLVAGHEAQVLLEWYDAPDSPLALTGKLEEASVARFAAAIGATYRRAEPGV